MPARKQGVDHGAVHVVIDMGVQLASVTPLHEWPIAITAFSICEFDSSLCVDNCNVCNKRVLNLVERPFG